MSSNIRKNLHEVVFETHTPSGRAFDIFLFICIFLSVIVVMLDSVPAYHVNYGIFFHRIEWAFTIIFTVEYLLRVILVKHPHKFIFSFLGIIDLVAILPTYLTLFIAGSQTLLILRALRLLRVFRIFRLSHFLVDIRFLSGALISSLRKIGIFFMGALVIVMLLGSVMYLVEDPKDGFTDIPQCIYWAITTITTVGYGDLIPHTPWGKFVANIVMLIGYAIIAVPTGIITTEMAIAIKSRDVGHDICQNCNKKGHDHDAQFCKHCGHQFPEHPKEKSGHGHDKSHTILPHDKH
ncbi:MAG TPA: ion transporter [Chitinophagaceae bacterium]|nr:ion transporter [Chitinophagaceae bacterium]